MSDDLLQRMTKALREEGGAEPSPDRSAQVRARVVAQSKRRAQLRPQGVWQWAAVVCLGFFVSTAMAQVISVQLPKAIEALREVSEQLPAALKKPKAAKKKPKVVAPVVPAAPKQPAAPSGEAGQAAVAPAAPSGEPEQGAAALAARSGEAGQAVAPSAPEHVAAAPAAKSVAPVKAAAPSDARPQRPRSVKSTRTAVAPPPVAAPPPVEAPLATSAPEEIEPAQPTEPPPAAAKVKPPESAELALFRRAQALHLKHDTRAIEAWDAYLRVAPTSALAPEARYNRALGLVRANRFAEAKRALAPFAEGKYGSYRREEAQALLVRLR